MPSAAEMDVFEGKVGGYRDFFANFGANEGAVVAYAEANSGALGVVSSSELGDQGKFAG